jgi:hypothetical protein
MISSGYSGTPLIQKLGIKSSMKIRLINAPADYSRWLGVSIRKQYCGENETADFIHLFSTKYSEFEKEMKKLKSAIKKNPAMLIWVSWYKKTAKMPTDITEDSIRGYALKNELVDVKVCAVSDLWSGLKLVVPLANR